jgi:hypothetical protein
MFISDMSLFLPLQYPGGTEAALAYILKRSTKCGNRIFKFWFGPFRPAVGLVHPETVKCILKTSEPKAMKDKGAYSLVVPWLGNSSVFEFITV